ncbi:MAG: cytochrome c [Bdellovibrionales bacterium]
MRHGLLLTATIFTVFLTVAAGNAADPDMAVKARRAVLKDFGREMKTLGGIAKGDIESERKQLIESARHMRELAPQPWPFFTQDTSVARAKTDAKPVIWSDPAGFRAAQENMIRAAEALSLAAATDKPDDIRAKIKALGDTCGACHKQFKD